ncbi:MAG: carbohydrate ABC transporter permease [Clostridia bacterium]|jgi:multiple sugar transport system permease protein|nr:carbohydrate ABC transporter permease [Clostridia bacterium]
MTENALKTYKHESKPSAKSIVAKTAIYLGLILFALWILIPFYIVVITSFKTRIEAQSPEFTLWPKDGFHWDGYIEVLGYKAGYSSIPVVWLGLLNTLLIVLPPTVIGLFTSSLAAYAFAKLRFKSKNFLFSVLLATMMIPGTIMLTPSYLLYDKIYWTGTAFPLMIPGMFGAAACVFFMRQFYMGIPTDLIEAAKLDGMGYFGIFFKIMVPLSVPALLAQGILGFIGGYNDYFGPYLYLTDPTMYTLQIALNSFQGTYASKWPTMMAGAVCALIPTLLIYILAQKYFIQGIATAGMKL